MPSPFQNAKTNIDKKKAYLLSKSYKTNYKTHKFHQFFKLEILRTKCPNTPKVYSTNEDEFSSMCVGSLII